MAKMINPEYLKRDNEEELDYAMRLIGIKKELKPGDLDWCDIVELLGLDYNPDSLRKSQDSKFGGLAVYREMRNKIINNSQEDFKNEIATELQKLSELKCSISDERANLNKLLKEKYRVEHIKEIAIKCVEKMKPFDFSFYNYDRNEDGNRAMIVTLSDFHYGLEINEFNNIYNKDIFKERLAFLYHKVLDEIDKNENISNVIVLGIGDFIAGLIHNVIRVESRENVVEQVIDISNALITFLFNISNYIHVDYYDCVGNHSRLFEDKNNCLSKESFDILIHHILAQRFIDCDDVTIHDYTINEKIGSFEVFNKKYAFCHGDGFSVDTIAKDLSSMTREFYEAIFIGHIHHVFVEEQNKTLVISNGSFAGNDEFANKIKKTSIPSQNIFIVSDRGIEDIKIIKLNERSGFSGAL